MTRQQLARNLAHSLTLGPWAPHFVRFTLTRRLPRQLHHHIDSIGTHLLSRLQFVYAPSVEVVAGCLLESHVFEKISGYCQKHDVWPKPDLSSADMWPIAAFAHLNIPPLPNLGALASFLSIPLARAEYLADTTCRYEDHADAAVNNYHYGLHPKKSGGLRVIEAPKAGLKAAQRRILDGILSMVPVHSCAFGFVMGRTCIQAANRHVGEQVVACFDLKDFFPSINPGRVFGLFRCLGYPFDVARVLTGLCTTATPARVVRRLEPAIRPLYRRPHLPQGSPASPALANLAAFTLDRRLAGLARKLDMNYSRYADDLTFSGDAANAGKLLRVLPLIVADEGFALNPGKTRLMSNTTRQLVTGLVVNDRVNVDRRLYDRLKAVIHACGKSEDTRLGDPEFRQSLLGQIAWVEAVNPHRGQKLLALLSRAAG